MVITSALLLAATASRTLLVDDVGDRSHQLADLRRRRVRGRPSSTGRGGDRLVHDGERVAHGAITGFGQQRERGSSATMSSAFGDVAQLPDDVVELDGVKAEVLAARADGLRDVLGLGGRHHEDDVVGRLFQGLEQGVEGGVGDLVGLVEDVDLVLVARGAITGGVAQLADLVDAAVGGGVDFDDVDRVAGADLEAGIADVAGLGRGAGSDADGVRQLSAMARMRAMVVLPMPRWPLKM